MTNKIWKTIPEFPNYEASDDGEIRNFSTKKVLKQTSSGYLGRYKSVSLWKDKKCNGPKYVHRLVAETFLGPQKTNTECSHLDGNPKNNKSVNLKWVSAKENAEHKKSHGTYRCGDSHHSRKVSDSDCLKIITHYLSGYSTALLASIYNVTNFRINHILSGRRKSVLIDENTKILIKSRIKSIKQEIAKRNSPW